MPEWVDVDVCYDTPCKWTPPPTLASGLDAVERHYPLPIQGVIDDYENDSVNMTQAVVGNDADTRTDAHAHVKRQSEPDVLPARQGPPLPEAPHNALGEPIEPVPTRQNSLTSIDPEVRQIAINRQQQAASSEYRVRRPASFHQNGDTRYILRPEAIESVFYMWRITGDPSWQDKGWQMWEAIEKVSWTELAYSAISNVHVADTPQTDSMER